MVLPSVAAIFPPPAQAGSLELPAQRATKAATSGRGSFTWRAARTRASLTRRARGGRPGGDLRLERLDLLLDVRDKRIGGELLDELLVGRELRLRILILLRRTGDLEELARI